MSSLLAVRKTQAYYSQTSNYAGNTYVLKDATYEQDIGSGVQKRVGWRQLPKIDKLKPLAYDKSWEKTQYTKWSYRHTERSGGTYLYNFQNGPFSSSVFATSCIFSGVVEEAQYKAKVKLFDQLQGEGANIANMIAERQQTIDMVANTIRKIALTIGDIRRRNFSSAFRRLFGDARGARRLRGKDIADTWIAIQYGIIPLMGDVYDIVNLSHRRITSLQPVTFRASSKHARNGPSDQSAAFFQSKNYGFRACVAVAKYMIRAFPNNKLASPAALGLTNPLVPLWEITPWSFVIDWFLPVGRYLEQLSATHGWTFHDGCYSTLIKGSEFAACTKSNNYTSSGWTYTNEWSWEWNCSYVRFARSVLTDFPTPSLPHFKNPVSTGHLKNALALLVQKCS